MNDKATFYYTRDDPRRGIVNCQTIRAASFDEAARRLTEQNLMDANLIFNHSITIEFYIWGGERYTAATPEMRRHYTCNARVRVDVTMDYTLTDEYSITGSGTDGD